MIKPITVARTSKGTFARKNKRWSKEPIPEQEVIRIIQLHYAGKSVRSIAKAISGIPKTRVHEIVSVLHIK